MMVPGGEPPPIYGSPASSSTSKILPLSAPVLIPDLPIVPFRFLGSLNQNLLSLACLSNQIPMVPPSFQLCRQIARRSLCPSTIAAQLVENAQDRSSLVGTHDRCDNFTTTKSSVFSTINKTIFSETDGIGQQINYYLGKRSLSPITAISSSVSS
jgi:hypothetical protein